MTEGASVREIIDQNPMVGEPRSAARRFWTGREEKLLRETYPSGIYNHARGMGIDGPATARRGGRPRERWASNEQIDRIITEVYQRAPKKNDIKKLAVTVGRPRWWVSKRAQKLGLVAPRFKEPPWSEAEIELVAANAHKAPPTIRLILAGKGFRRSPTAILVKLKRLGTGTGKNADVDHYTATALAKLFGIDVKSLTRWIDKGWLRAAKRGTARVEAQGGDEWWIHRRDIRAFIIESTAAVDIRKVDKFWFVEILVNGGK